MLSRPQSAPDPLDVGWRDKPPSLRSFVDMIRRQASIVGIAVGAGIVISLIAIILTQPMYTARVSLYVDAVGATDAPRSEVATAVDLDTHVELIRSEHTTTQVIQALNLAQEPEFATSRSRLRAIVDGLRSLVGMGSGDDEPVDPALALILKVQNGLKVARNGNTRIIDLQYTSTSPRLSVAIVNAFAHSYIDSAASRDESATARRVSRLSDRAEQMRLKASDADERIRTILHQSGLFTADPQEIAGRISALRQQLSEHEAKIAALSAKLAIYSNYENSGDLTTIDTPQGRQLLADLITAKQQLVDARQKPNASSNLVSAMENRIANLEASLRQEIRFEVQAIEIERTMTTAEQDDIKNQIAKLGDYVASDAWTELQTVRQDKSFYEGMYQEYLTQLENAGREKPNQADLRIVADALTPLSPSSPNIKVWLAISVCLAALIGIGIASLREWNRNERPRS